MGKNKYQYNKMNSNTANHYQATLFGKIAMVITAPSVIISFISVIVAFFGVVEALFVCFITLALSVIGGILITADIVAFNFRQKKKNPIKSEKTGVDMARMWHLIAGLALGILIGYLIWGVR